MNSFLAIQMYHDIIIMIKRREELKMNHQTPISANRAYPLSMTRALWTIHPIETPDSTPASQNDNSIGCDLPFPSHQSIRDIHRLPHPPPNHQRRLTWDPI